MIVAQDISFVNIIWGKRKTAGAKKGSFGYGLLKNPNSNSYICFMCENKSHTGHANVYLIDMMHVWRVWTEWDLTATFFFFNYLERFIFKYKGFVVKGGQGHRQWEASRKPRWTCGPAGSQVPQPVGGCPVCAQDLLLDAERPR